MATVNDMTVGKPTTQILNFALPLVLGYLLQQLYNVTDAAIVGQFVGVDALAAVGASSSIMFLVMGFCCGTCQGFAIPVAQAFGAKDEHLMRCFVSGAKRLAIIIAVAMTIVTCLACKWILHMVNTPEAIMPQASLYLYLQFLLIPVAIAYNLLASFIRALGNSRQPFYFLIVSSLLNIGLDIVFVAVLRWGVAGAGAATIIAQAWAAGLCWRFINREMPVLKTFHIMRWGRMRYAPTNDGRMPTNIISILLWNGLPMGLQFSITAIGSIMLQRANNALGTQYVAAFTASMRVKYLFTCVFENIGVAMATYCGQNLGAGRIDRIRQGLRAALRITAVYFLFTLAVIYPLADKLMLLFVDPSEQLILAEAARFMRTCNYFYPVLGLLTVLRYSIQGMGYAHLSMLSGVMEMLARTGVSLWLVPAFGFTGVIMGDPVAWLSADAFLVPCMLLLLRHQRKKEGAVGFHDRQILRLALPSIVQNITVPLLGLCDVAIVGHIGDATYIGAIAVGSMIFNVMYWLFVFLRMGTSGLTAQARGARHFAQAMAVLRQGLLFGVGVGLLIIVMQLPIRWLSFTLMRPTADVATLCHPYFAICIWGAPAMLGLYALTGWFIGMQNTRTPMLIAIVQNVVNILLSLFFVFFLHLQVEGVALGTLIAQWTGFLLALFLLKTTKSNHNFSLFTIHFSLKNYSLFTINYQLYSDLFLRTLCLVAVNFFFTSAGAAQGALMLAVNTLLMQLFTLYSYFMDGFAYAGEALVGRYYGAGDRQSQNAVVRRLFGWGLGVTVLFTLLYWIGGTTFLHLLTSDAAVVEAARDYLPWALLIPVSGMAAFVWDGVFVGLTYSRGMLKSCGVATVAFFLLWASLHTTWANHALWLALIVYLALRGIVQSWLYRRNYC